MLTLSHQEEKGAGVDLVIFDNSTCIVLKQVQHLAPGFFELDQKRRTDPCFETNNGFFPVKLRLASLAFGGASTDYVGQKPLYDDENHVIRQRFSVLRESFDKIKTEIPKQVWDDEVREFRKSLRKNDGRSLRKASIGMTSSVALTIVNWAIISLQNPRLQTRSLVCSCNSQLGTCICCCSPRRTENHSTVNRFLLLFRTPYTQPLSSFFVLETHNW